MSACASDGDFADASAELTCISAEVSPRLFWRWLLSCCFVALVMFPSPSQRSQVLCLSSTTCLRQGCSSLCCMWDPSPSPLLNTRDDDEDEDENDDNPFSAST